MPPLNEGDLLFMPIADPSVSLEENTRIAQKQNAALLKFQEVQTVVAKVARADTSTDPAPLNMTETIVKLKPRSAWRPGMTLERLRSEMTKAVELPGVSTIWTMPIANRIDMLTTGIRSEVGVKIFGSDLSTLDGLARQIADVLRSVPGAANVYPEPLTSGQYLNIRIDRAAAARYGLGVGAVQDVIEQAIGETVVGSTIEGRRRFPIRVRYARPFRADVQAIGDATVFGPAGQQVPLRAVAAIESARGPAMISSENGLIVATVLLNVQGRDTGSFIDAAREAVSTRVALPAGYYLGWSGRYENQEHARRRLIVVVPVVLLVVFVLLLFHLSLGHRSRARPARRAVRAHWRRVPRLAPWLQLFSRGLGWIHRAVRHRRSDRRGDGHLSRRGRRAAAGPRWRRADPEISRGSRHRRRIAAPEAEGDDGLDGGCGPAADHVEHACWRGSHEAHRRSGAWRNAVLAGACVAGDTRHLLLAPGQNAGA